MQVKHTPTAHPSCEQQHPGVIVYQSYGVNHLSEYPHLCSPWTICGTSDHPHSHESRSFSQTCTHESRTCPKSTHLARGRLEFQSVRATIERMVKSPKSLAITVKNLQIRRLKDYEFWLYEMSPGTGGEMPDVHNINLPTFPLHVIHVQIKRHCKPWSCCGMHNSTPMRKACKMDE